jgi:hypothetical protein
MDAAEMKEQVQNLLKENEKTLSELRKRREYHEAQIKEIDALIIELACSLDDPNSPQMTYKMQMAKTGRA